MKIAIVHLEAERGWGHDHDHLALEPSSVTLCGKTWSTKTRRESLKDTGERTPCYRCTMAARQKVVVSLEAAYLLTRTAGLDWRELRRAAMVP